MLEPTWQVITDFTDKIKALGPNPIKKKDQGADTINWQLDAAIHAGQQFRLRSLFGREKKISDMGNAYGDRLSAERIEEVEDSIILDEYIRSNIVLAVESEAKTVEEMSREIGYDTETVFKHVARLWKKQIILPHGHKDLSPTYLKAGGV